MYYAIKNVVIIHRGEDIKVNEFRVKFLYFALNAIIVLL